MNTCTQSNLHTHINTLTCCKRTHVTFSFTKQSLSTHTHTLSFHYASCADRRGCLQLRACHMLMYSTTHSNWRGSSALKYSPISLRTANGSNPASYSSFYFLF
ncbi:hypothetical protein AMECASPLE_035560 [Ameca splendens]|uniref:Uncharacterized protein n=1 Tax=Ameca splendens TaxID=208324 RepID=A0ABV0Y831_9TELE